MTELYYLILFPIGVGIFLWIIPERGYVIKGVIAAITSAIVMYFSILLFQQQSQIVRFLPFNNLLKNFKIGDEIFYFNIDPLSKTISLFIAFFGLLISVYSILYLKGHKRVPHYYSFFLITTGSAIGVVLSDHLFTFITLWGLLGFTLYKLIKGHDELSSAAAKKTMILIGASDSVMIFGIGLVWILTKTLRISQISIETNLAAGVVAFATLLVGSITKAGAFPLHTWVPDYAEGAPASSSAFMPASLDKLLGIYLLARICVNLFILNPWLNLALLIIGSITIIAAVLMALIQHDYKRLLGYHAVSQVGYMVTGLGLGTPIGIAGGLFHMFNNALYKSGLFLSAGCVEKQTGENDLDNVGGLARLMPITFISVIIYTLSISGVPPFNGFASKWLIYQGIIEFGKSQGPANKVWMIWLIMAVFGSALTLASFIKFTSGIFLGRLKEKLSETKEVGFLMWLPLLIIALVCAGTGIIASGVIIPKMIVPITGSFEYPGIWSSSFVTLLIVVSIVIGFLLYLAGKPAKVRRSAGYVGGEVMVEELDFAPTDYYKTISFFKIFKCFYERAEKRFFDIYDGFKALVLWLNTVFSRCHTGRLPLYALWVVIGMLLIVIILMI